MTFRIYSERLCVKLQVKLTVEFAKVFGFQREGKGIPLEVPSPDTHQQFLQLPISE